jgi:hypothetical protein
VQLTDIEETSKALAQNLSKANQQQAEAILPLLQNVVS